MEAGKTPSSSSEEDVSLIPPQHVSKKGAEEEDNSVSSSSSEEDVSLIPPQHLSKKRAEEEDDDSVSDVSLILPQHFLPKKGAEEEEYSAPHDQHLSNKWAGSSLQFKSFPGPFAVNAPAMPVKHKEEDCFIVKLSQNGNLDGEQYESIHKQEAVCRLCSKMLGEDDSVLKTKCKCHFTLLHTTCGDQWSAPKCNSCQQIILTVPVTISSSRPNSAKKPRKKKGGCCSFFMKK